MSRTRKYCIKCQKRFTLSDLCGICRTRIKRAEEWKSPFREAGLNSRVSGMRSN